MAAGAGGWKYPMTSTSLNPSSAFSFGVGNTATVPLLRVPTVRNWLRAFAWTLAIIGVSLILYVPDKWFPFNGAQRLVEYRMFKNPSTIPMRIFGIPHFLIAVLFLMSSRRMKETRSKLIFVALSVLGVLFCLLFKRVGANLNPFAVFIFYFYFLIHGFRDDAFFYKTFGDMPREAALVHNRIMVVLQCLLIGMLVSLFWPTYAQMSQTYTKLSDPILSNFFPADWPYVLKLSSMFVPMLLIAVVALFRIARAFPAGFADLWRTHRPILAVYLMSLAVVLIALLGGSGAFDVWVLMHFVAWYFFALFILYRHPPKAPQASLWGWMRTTPKGFITLHFALVGVVCVLMAVSVYTYGQKAGPFDWVVGRESFFYWTILHVTWSFVPR